MNSPFGMLFLLLLMGIFAYQGFVQFLNSTPKLETPSFSSATLLALAILAIALVNFYGTFVLITSLVTLLAGTFRWECLAQRYSWVLVDPSCLGEYFPFTLFLAALVVVMSSIFCFVLGKRRLAKEK